ncbi:MAG: hypothetical protein ACN4GW_09085 [Desulforhopalus sp.]
MAANTPKESAATLKIPWWGSVLMAVACYTLLKYFIPTLQTENHTLQPLIEAAPTFAPLTAIPFLLLAAKQLYDVAPTEGKDGTEEERGEGKPEE